MRDCQLKCQTIRQIQHLQLSENWIVALDQAEQATEVLKMLNLLEQASQQWN